MTAHRRRRDRDPDHDRSQGVAPVLVVQQRRAGEGEDRELGELSRRDERRFSVRDRGDHDQHRERCGGDQESRRGQLQAALTEPESSEHGDGEQADVGQPDRRRTDVEPREVTCPRAGTGRR